MHTHTKGIVTKTASISLPKVNTLKGAAECGQQCGWNGGRDKEYREGTENETWKHPLLVFFTLIQQRSWEVEAERQVKNAQRQEWRGWGAQGERRLKEGINVWKNWGESKQVEQTGRRRKKWEKRWWRWLKTIFLTDGTLFRLFCRLLPWQKCLTA